MSQNKNQIKGMMLADTSMRGGQYVGNWRVYMPEVDYEKCVACRICLMYCPEAAIRANEQNKPEIDMRFCKGCGVCANECPQGAIEMVKEEA